MNAEKYNIGEEEQSLPQAVVEMLIKKGLTISAAESCTGGMFAKMITDISGSSAVLNESYVTYANEAKTKILGVKSETLEKYGAVSEQTAYEMAQGLYKVSQADVCVCFTGIAGPGGGTKEKPVGLVYVGLCIKGRVEVIKLNLKGSRDEIRNGACLEIFDKIRKKVQKL
ncbi:MAG: nicotinamide-nucleotide amidohydrolase family protein [Clostridia bacterium]|nr:nicotinamide-nucleotide amidohydrolase family protein [Clostridia bacterium]